MSENQSNVAIIQGKVEEVHMHEGKHYHRLTLPAPDSYTQPQAAMVVASQRLAEPGQELKTRARIRGWSRRFKRKDGGTGHEVNTSFEVV
jgi:hypothetical protein